MTMQVNRMQPKSVQEEEELEVIASDMFEYHPWDEEQQQAGAIVRSILKQAFKLITKHVPPCADRSTAIRKLREARMDCNSAITHRGKY